MRTAVDKMIKYIRSVGLSFSEMSKARIRELLASRNIRIVKISENLINAENTVVTLVYNESSRLEFFVNYYKEMGFQQFIFIDNDSSDDTLSILIKMDCVSVFSVRGSFVQARFGMDWVNRILKTYCVNKWVLHVDADEFFCYPRATGENIKGLTDYLDSRGERSLNCILLDMYSDVAIESNIYKPGQDPLDITRLYDGDGYQVDYNEITRTTWIKGGVRGRFYFPGREWDGPALNKTPLVKWRSHYAFIKCAHELWPFYLNLGSRGSRRISGALLHMKFLSDFVTKLKIEEVRAQHSNEYQAYNREGSDTGKDILVYDKSRTFTDWRSLVMDGLIDDPDNVSTILHSDSSPFKLRQR